MGGVVTPTEDEKFKNLIKQLQAEIAIRKRKFFELGVSSYAAYRDAGKNDLPRIVLMIDNFTALRELYLMDTDPIQAICQNGITYGICVKDARRYLPRGKKWGRQKRCGGGSESIRPNSPWRWYGAVYGECYI